MKMRNKIMAMLISGLSLFSLPAPAQAESFFSFHFSFGNSGHYFSPYRYVYAPAYFYDWPSSYYYDHVVYAYPIFSYFYYPVAYYRPYLPYRYPYYAYYPYDHYHYYYHHNYYSYYPSTHIYGYYPRSDHYAHHLHKYPRRDHDWHHDDGRNYRRTQYAGNKQYFTAPAALQQTTPEFGNNYANRERDNVHSNRARNPSLTQFRQNIERDYNRNAFNDGPENRRVQLADFQRHTRRDNTAQQIRRFDNDQNNHLQGPQPRAEKQVTMNLPETTFRKERTRFINPDAGKKVATAERLREPEPRQEFIRSDSVQQNPEPSSNPRQQSHQQPSLSPQANQSSRERISPNPRMESQAMNQTPRQERRMDERAARLPAPESQRMERRDMNQNGRQERRMEAEQPRQDHRREGNANRAEQRSMRIADRR